MSKDKTMSDEKKHNAPECDWGAPHEGPCIPVGEREVPEGALPQPTPEALPLRPSNEDALTARCTTCGARPGERCVHTFSGKPLRDHPFAASYEVHVGRVQDFIRERIDQVDRLRTGP